VGVRESGGAIVSEMVQAIISSIYVYLYTSKFHFETFYKSWGMAGEARVE
jgi:hypothetical protein